MGKNLQFDHSIYCDFPDSQVLQKAFLNLPDGGRVEVTCSMSNLGATLTELTRIGYFGIRILMSDIVGPIARISAFKGKSGPCYDTGRIATYTGSAIAALDDDSHLLFGPTPVCEKTADIYSCQIYQDVVKVSEPDPVLLKRLDTNPEPFNCDNYDENVRALAEALTSKSKRSETKKAIFYSGPFRILILANGAILKRGLVTNIETSYVKKLQELDNCSLLYEDKNISSVSAEFFQDVYNTKGLLCLIEMGSIATIIHHSDNINFSALCKTSKNILLRLQKVISQDDNYFILTGSDPWDIYGCCPSEDVGAANRLVEAGILETWHTTHLPDSCPTTVFAFNGEIHNKYGRPFFTKNAPIREQVLNHFTKNGCHWQKYLIRFIRLSLLLFALVAIVVTILKTPQMKGDITYNFPSNFISDQEIVMVYLSHFGISCEFCEKMKMLTQNTLNHHYANYIKTGKIKYQSVNMDDPQNTSFVKYFDLYSNSLIFVHKKNGNIMDYKIITDKRWVLSDSESKFTEMIREELTHFMNKIK